ncbi:replicative DNA helicase [Orientia tsutsugamushi]|uniref:Replicative DNA helicase n=1 Tax=Orientia tsutsugamushi TaxID=784 RepID=A0A2U3R3Y7_ORITS|nr:replicative DNA helicase [Orientia tsutsugamushi]
MKTVQDEIQKWNFFIDDAPASSISAIRSRARRLKRTHNLAILFIDYLQLIKIDNRGSQYNRVQEISEITQSLKALAKELNISIIALSQLSRAVEQRSDKKPIL